MSLWNRLQSTFRRPREIESRIDDELQFHLDMKTDELVAAGHPQAEASAMARRQLGNTTKLREEAREMDLVLWIENWGLDFKQSVRSLLLAAIGIHGLFAADVATRWKEFGVRLALGGAVGDLRNMLLTRAAWLLAIGCALGIAAVVATSKLLESAVEGLQPARLSTGFVVAALVLLAALVAIWWPLRRLSRVDPSSALRHE